MPHVNTHQLANGELYQLRMARWKARTDLTYLAREILGYPDVTGSERFPFMKHLQKFPLPSYDDLEKFDRLDRGNWVYTPPQSMLALPGGRRVLILDPRGFLKTTINAQSHSIQWILNYPDVAMTIIQSNGKKSRDILGEVKRHFQANPRFRALFPEHCPQKRIFDWGNLDEFTTEARGRQITRKEKTLMTGSIDTGSAGYHFDVMKFSDIVEPNNVKTADQLESVIQSFGMMENLLVAPSYWIDVEGTRYDFSDLYGQIIKAESKKPPEKRQWKIHVRGCYKKETESGDEKFTPEELDLPYLYDADGKKISWWPERWPVEELEARRTNPTIGEYIFACSAGDQKILMADWSEKEIADVKIGDDVIGFSKNGTGRNQLTVSRVKNVGKLADQAIFRYTTKTGRVTYQTIDHKWYNAHTGKYAPVQEADTLFSCYTPKTLTREQEKAALWLGGFFDGEGTISGKTAATIYQSERVNPETFARLRSVLGMLNIEHSEYFDQRAGVTHFRINGGRTTKLFLLNQCDVAKRPAISEALWATRGNPVEDQGQETVISVEFVERGDVYWLETETGNYVVSGFLSANCQQLNNPVALEDKSAVPFPVDREYPKWISLENFRRNVRVVHYTTTVDTAETQNERSNYSAITTVGWDQAGRPYLVEVRHGKWLPDKLNDEIIATQLKWAPLYMSVEETSYVRGLKDGLLRRLQIMGLHINFRFIRRETTISKKERILNTLQPWYKQGELRFVRGLGYPEDSGEAARVTEELIEELRRFPKYSQDDIIDSLADHFQGREWLGRLGPKPANPWDNTTSEDQRRELHGKMFEAMIGISQFPFETVNTDHGYVVPVPSDSFYAKTGGL